jgi:hypothetical protein
MNMNMRSTLIINSEEPSEQPKKKKVDARAKVKCKVNQIACAIRLSVLYWQKMEAADSELR